MSDNPGAKPVNDPAWTSTSEALTDDLGSQLDSFQQDTELADPDADLPTLDRIINKSVEAVGVLALTTVFVVVFASTTGRYLFNHPLIWGEEVAIGIIPWMVAIGMFLSVRRRHMVRIEFLANKLPPKFLTVVNFSSQILSVFVFAYIAWSAFRYVSFFGGDPTPFLGLPKGLSTSAFVFAGAATTLAFVVGLVKGTLIFISEGGEQRT